MRTKAAAARRTMSIPIHLGEDVHRTVDRGERPGSVAQLDALVAPAGGRRVCLQVQVHHEAPPGSDRAELHRDVSVTAPAADRLRLPVVDGQRVPPASGEDERRPAEQGVSLDVEPALVEETAAKRTWGRDTQRRRVRPGDEYDVVLAEHVREGSDHDRREQCDNGPPGRPLDEMAVVPVPFQVDAIGRVRRPGHAGVIPSSRRSQTASLGPRRSRRNRLSYPDRVYLWITPTVTCAVARSIAWRQRPRSIA